MKEYYITKNYYGEICVETEKYNYKIEKVNWMAEIGEDEFFVTYANIESYPVIIEGVFTCLTIDDDDAAKQVINDINKQLGGQAQLLGPYEHKKTYCLSYVTLESIDNTFVLVKELPNNIHMSDLEKILKKGNMFTKPEEG